MLPFAIDQEIAVLDMCCGPGDLGRFVRARFPEARIDCVDRVCAELLISAENQQFVTHRIQDELKLIAKTRSDLNAHAIHPHLVEGAILLKAQMKEASQQVGGMRKIASQFETNWMNTIKKALVRKCSPSAQVGHFEAIE